MGRKAECGGGDADEMKPQKWPVYRQLTGTDRRGLGAAAKSDRPRVARTSTADAVVKSVSPTARSAAPRTYVPIRAGADIAFVGGLRR
jgi:hypothetical protein